jgi:hypothetical protein
MPVDRLNAGREATMAIRMLLVGLGLVTLRAPPAAVAMMPTDDAGR